MVVECSNGCIVLTDSLYIDFKPVEDRSQEDFNFLQHDRLFYFAVGLCGLRQDMTELLCCCWSSNHKKTIKHTVKVKKKT